jgi:hypothetical protein
MGTKATDDSPAVTRPSRSLRATCENIVVGARCMCAERALRPMEGRPPSLLRLSTLPTLPTLDVELLCFAARLPSPWPATLPALAVDERRMDPPPR